MISVILAGRNGGEYGGHGKITEFSGKSQRRVRRIVFIPLPERGETFFPVHGSMPFWGMLSGAGRPHLASTRSETLSASEPEVVTLNIEFLIGTNQLVFRCGNSSGYYIQQIDMWIHNVDIHHPGAGTEYNTTAWIQFQGPSGSYSEVVPCSLTPYSYVDLSTIQVESDAPADCVFQFNITGIPAR